MSIPFMMTALLIVSLITNLTVEGIKKLLDEAHKKYSSNLLAAIVAIIVALVTCVGYLIISECTITPKVIVEILGIMYLGFLIATVGYDKVIQTIMQLQKGKEENQNE